MIPSIFNDVLGPVMRGPSSSHVAAAARIGALACSASPATTRRVCVSFGANSSLVHTYHSQGSDMGFAAGYAGISLDDPKAPGALEQISVPLTFAIRDDLDQHPNNYRVRIEADTHTVDFQATSIGGGMIELWELCGVPVTLFGDRFAAVLLCICPEEAHAAFIERHPGVVIEHFGADERQATLFTSTRPLDSALLGALRAHGMVISFSPVLPVLTPENVSLPFADYRGLQSYLCTNPGMRLWEAACDYECARSGKARDAVLSMADGVLRVMESAVEQGLVAQEYCDRILPSQAYRLVDTSSAARTFPLPEINPIIASVTAVMESKSSMHPIVAAPTAGSCGCLAGTLVAQCGHEREAKVRALLAGGLVGVLFCAGATLAAEVAGCQVECGAASGMTAAALTDLCGGSAQNGLDAAAMAIQGLTGLACDPVAGRVEVPCLGKNIAAAANALCCAHMALAGFTCVVPLDETIAAVAAIGAMLPAALKCTQGGLGCAQSSIALANRLNENRVAK